MSSWALIMWTNKIPNYKSSKWKCFLVTALQLWYLKKTKQNDCVIVTWLGTTLEVSVLKSLTHAFLPSGFIEFLQIPSGLSLTQTGHGKKLKIRPTTVNSKGKELVWEFLSWDLRQSPGLSLNLLWNRGILTSCPASLQGSPDTQMS